MIDKGKLLKHLRLCIEVGKNGLYASTVHLMQTGQGPTNELVEEWSAPLDAREILQGICDAVERHSVGSDDPIVRYRVYFCFGDDRTKTMPFPINIENVQVHDPDTSTFLAEEGVHAKGLLAQTRRHLEAREKLAVGMPMEIIRRLQDDIRDLRERNAHLMSERERNVLLREELMDRKQERQIKAAQAAAAQRRKDQFLEFLIPFIPIIINKIQGARTLPETTHPDVEQFKIFLSTIKPEEFGQLGQLLGPRVAPIMDLLQKYRGEFEQKEQNRENMIASMIPDMPRLPESEEENPPL